jgi:hypothetical protein
MADQTQQFRKNCAEHMDASSSYRKAHTRRRPIPEDAVDMAAADR